jgi:hypothetical protein
LFLPFVGQRLPLGGICQFIFLLFVGRCLEFAAQFLFLAAEAVGQNAVEVGLGEGWRWRVVIIRVSSRVGGIPLGSGCVSRGYPAAGLAVGA